MSPLPASQSTALLVPVPEAEALVGALRLDHDPSAAAGVPAHVTVVVPFLPQAELDAAVISELRSIIGKAGPFDFRLASVGWFGRTVLYLAPEPATPFVSLTRRMTESFGTEPYEGEYDDIVPHLTVAHASDGVELATIAEQLRPALPINCRADEVWLMEGDGVAWKRQQRFPLDAADGD